MSASIVWFRNDLRLADNPALAAAVARGEPILPVFIWAPEEEGKWQPGAASRWWLHQSLVSLEASLRERGSRLIVCRGPSLDALRHLLREANAAAVLWNRRYEPAARARDAAIKTALRSDGLRVDTFNAALLFEPWAISTAAGTPFQVFTPFWKACLKNLPAAAKQRAPKRFPVPTRWPRSLAINELELEPQIDWAAGIRAAWRPGEDGAAEQLTRFLDGALAGYPDDRDRPDRSGTPCRRAPRSTAHLSYRPPPTSIYARSAGGSSRITCCSISRTPPKRRSAVHSRASPGTKTRQRCVPGNAGAPGTRSSTPACVSCGRPVGCTTAYV